MPKKGEKFLLIETEPHPLSYAKFEGEIEEGYGAGIVEIVDSGIWELLDYKPNRFTFKLDGKYEGIYTLIHYKNKQWLLIAKKGGNNVYNRQGR